jgi:hypothetical protein
MTKRKTGSEIEVLPPPDEEVPDIGSELRKSVEHLLSRVRHEVMTVAEETAAIKACTAYYLDVVKDTPGKTGEGAFNGYRDAITNIPTNRRSRNGGRDGATDDPGGF